MPQDDDFLFAGPSRAANSRLRITRFAMLALAACLALMTLLVVEARSSETGSPATTASQTRLAGLVRPDDMNSGALLLPSKEPGFYVEAPRLKTDVVIDVSGTILRTRVTQRFENPTDGWLEGTYVFPLPENAAVDTLKMQIGERLVEGRIKRRDEARAIYEEAKAAGQKAALLEQQRPNIFTNQVANIGPRETVVVQIEYQETVRMSGGEFSFRFPMVVAPRYNPQPIVQTVDFGGSSGFAVTDPVPDRDKITAPVLDPRENAKINPVALTVNLKAGFPLGAVATPFHEMVETVNADASRSYALKAESVPADRDFEMTWKAAAGAAPSAGLFRQVIAGDTYLLAFVTPPAIADTKPLAREVIFVIDNSGSMAGESIVQAREALALAIGRLQPQDRFNVVRFDDTFDVFYSSPVAATPDKREDAIARVRRLEAEGGTEMLPALRAALTAQGPVADGALRQIVFLTDGAIGNEAELFDAISRQRGEARVFTVGIGSAPNSFFMTRAAEIGRGTFTHVGSDAQIGPRMGELFAKLESPAMTGIAASIDGGLVAAFQPDPIPDLYRGEPVVLTAKIEGGDAKGTITLTGTIGDQPWRTELPIDKAAEGKGIDKVWARRAIESLEASSAYQPAEIEARDRKIEEIALAHTLVSRLTSLVAVDVTPSRPGDAPLGSARVPLNLPAGWEFDKVFGDAEAMPAPTLQRDASTGSVMPVARMAALGASAKLIAAAPTQEAAAAIAAATPAPVALPQTATLADLYLLIGFMLIFSAILAIVVARAKRTHAPTRVSPSLRSGSE